MPPPGPARDKALEWLDWKVGGLDPMLGELGFFAVRSSQQAPLAIDWFTEELAAAARARLPRVRHDCPGAARPAPGPARCFTCARGRSSSGVWSPPSPSRSCRSSISPRCSSAPRAPPARDAPGGPPRRPTASFRPRQSSWEAKGRLHRALGQRGSDRSCDISKISASLLPAVVGPERSERAFRPRGARRGGEGRPLTRRPFAAPPHRGARCARRRDAA